MILLIEPLYTLFNKILIEGYFPDVWKIAFIVSIFNAGDKGYVQNYRPISIINSSSKIFEQFLFQKLYGHLSKFVIKEHHMVNN